MQRCGTIRAETERKAHIAERDRMVRELLEEEKTQPSVDIDLRGPAAKMKA